MKKDKQNDDGGKHQFAATTMSEPLPGYEHKRVPYALVRPDPNQPRKEFPEAGLKELADSIREKGIVQDLILELVGERGHDPLQPYYRIVCGERRWRAAGIVGLAEVPAKVYQELAPAQRWAVQIIKNHQRENLTALEEAATFARQIEERRRSDPDFSAETLARETGMSRAAIYERLKLNRLLTPVRKALEAGQKLRDERKALAEGLAPQAAKGMNALTDKDAWALLVKRMSKWEPPQLKKLYQHVKGDRARVLAYHLNDVLGAVADYTTGEWDKETLALWKALGVDLKAEWDKQKTTGPRTTDHKTEELPLKTEAKQKTFEAIVTKRNKGGQLTLETKAKIIAAQKARWAKVRAKKN